MAVIDTRLIQTAVIGGRDSEQPVILPEEAHNLDQFRLRYSAERFWCGTLLGGCGEPLTTKRYEDKVCHFSHYPDPQGLRDCRRAAYGAESADHLFIKRHVKAWLAVQGHAAQADLRSHGQGPADAVDFWLRATERLLRFELRPQGVRSWIPAAESLAATSGHVEWVFGCDCPLVSEMVARQGHALRSRCETSGADRRVLIGVADGTGATVWAPLEECRMTKEGLTPPALDTLRADGSVRPGGMSSPPLPASLPLRGADVVFTLDPTATPPLDSPVAGEGRYLVGAHVKPAGSRIVRAFISLPADTPPPTEEYVYQLSGVARLLISDAAAGGTAHWAIRADGLVGLTGLDAERTGLWLPAVAVTPQPSPFPAASTDGSGPVGSPVRRGRQAARLRDALLATAARRTTTTWKQLASQARLDLSRLSDRERRDLLVEVDAPAAPGSPSLSVLIRTPSGGALPYLSDVLRTAGVNTVPSDATLHLWCGEETERTYAAIPTSGPSPKPEKKPFSPRPAALQRLRQLNELVDEAQRLLSRTTGRRAHRLGEGIRQARLEIAAFEKARANRQTYSVSSRVIDELDRVVGRPATEQPAAARIPRQTATVTAQQPVQPPHRSELAELRPLLEKLTAAGNDIDTSRLRTDMARAKYLKGSIHATLPKDLLTMYAVCSQRLAQREQADIASATSGIASVAGPEGTARLPESELDAVSAARPRRSKTSRAAGRRPRGPTSND